MDNDLRHGLLDTQYISLVVLAVSGEVALLLMVLHEDVFGLLSSDGSVKAAMVWHHHLLGCGQLKRSREFLFFLNYIKGESSSV